MKTVLVAGASGLIGSAAVEHFAMLGGWRVLALSRRKPFVDPRASFEHIAADLTQKGSAPAVLRAAGPVTHLIYTAVSEAPGLVEGWIDPARMRLNLDMLREVLDPLAGGALQHVGLLQGAKAYGSHVHPVSVPSREAAPRDPHENFYWLHEDHLRAAAAQAKFSWTIWRPQIVVGGAPGAAMNPVSALGAYAAICREIGRPFAFPGRAPSLWELADCRIIAAAMAWATDAPAARNEIFNVTNGDGFVLAHAWTDIAQALGLCVDADEPITFTSFFAEHEDVWPRIVARHGLAPLSLRELLGQSDRFLDLLLGNIRPARGPLSQMLSTIKLRKAGFGDCIDSRDSVIHWLKELGRRKLLPPWP